MNPHAFQRAVGSILAIATVLLLEASLRAGESDGAIAHYRDVIQPILEEYCYDCHDSGAKKGGLELDASPDKLLPNQELWLAVLNNLRAGIMPPARKEKPSALDEKRITDWIKTDVFHVDPKNPDPGHVTVRRLNRLEYQNTVRDLVGFESSEIIFPPDDTGFGFDNIGDVLSLSPLLLEKYLQSAKTIVAETVPTVRQVVPRQQLTGNDFKTDDGDDGSRMAYDKSATVRKTIQIEHPGKYVLHIKVMLKGSFDFDSSRCQVTFAADGQELFKDKYAWEERKSVHYRFDRQWQPGGHQLVFSVQPLENVKVEEKASPTVGGRTYVNFHILSVAVEGPVDPIRWEHPKSYLRFFPRDEPPSDAQGLREYARQVLFPFVRRAFRRIPDERVLDRLVDLAEREYRRPDKTFEAGVAQAMAAVLASPRFLFRIESPDPSSGDARFPLIDEYSLASRLSYFLWSTMPDDELFGLAERGELRANLDAQVARMLIDQRSSALERNFVGQWLRARDVERVPVNAAAALGFQKELEEVTSVFRRRFNSKADSSNPVTDEELAEARRKSRALRPITEKFNAATRIAMRRETEMFFGHIMRNDRSLLELVDSRYTFVNERLAELYGIEGVKGAEMRLVKLPSGSPRGGVLTQGTMLSVTSNPSRTSPVKRGVFILENILGTPPPPPPSDVPELEAAAKEFGDEEPTLREVLEIHRKSKLCSSCHARMDPLGLALENFNAIGMWRDTEHGQPIDATGKLITGESFRNVRDLKRILVEHHASDVYRCVTKKMMTYALGRGLEKYDEFSVDQIVDDLEESGGRFNTLLMGVVRSAAFQRQRRMPRSIGNKP